MPQAPKGVAPLTRDATPSALFRTSRPSTIELGRNGTCVRERITFGPFR